MIFDFKNGCKNEFNDNKEKSCSWSRNRVSWQIDFKVQWLRNSHADSVEVNNDSDEISFQYKVVMKIVNIYYFRNIYILTLSLTQSSICSALSIRFRVFSDGSDRHWSFIVTWIINLVKILWSFLKIIFQEIFNILNHII